MAETVVCIGAVVMHGERILLVRQSAGHSLAGQWTIPWGRLERGESPAAAAQREVREEGGVTAAVRGLLGVQELPPPWAGWIALVYLCDHVAGAPAPEDRETDAAAYYSPSDFVALTEPIEPWTAWLVRRLFAGRCTIIGVDESHPLRPGLAFL